MPTALNEDRLAELLLQWDELRRQCRDASARELCADSPEFIDELARRIEVVRDLDSVLDMEDTAGLSRPYDRDPGGVIGNHELPDAWRASAEYRPQRHHAYGGSGQIVIAHQQELDRTVAVKRIRPDRLHDKARDRFLREAAITARLRHPGIVPIYGLGQDDDGPFYTMPFILGKTLHEEIERFQRDDPFRRDPGRRSLEFRGLIQRFVTVCDTMAYAHDQGIVHRDLKPSNIMLGLYGETLVMDWGLAKPFDQDGAAGESEEDARSTSPSPEELTATGSVVGTPQYMSPEQARGQPAGPASDIFSLGLILYAILTGKSAFDDASFRGDDALKAVRDAAVVPPRDRDPSLPPALEAICLKALSARPEERYRCARSLAEDITKWLADEPVSAWREPWPVRGRRWVKRHRASMAATAAGCAAALLLGGINGYAYQGQVKRETSAAEAAAARAEQIRIDARSAWSGRLDASAWVRAEAPAADAAHRAGGRPPANLSRRLRELAVSAKAEAE